jgi:hypothetical protein
MLLEVAPVRCCLITASSAVPVGCEGGAQEKNNYASASFGRVKWSMLCIVQRMVSPDSPCQAVQRASAVGVSRESL